MIRRCSQSGCDTVLSRYNEDDRCSLHPHWEPTARAVRPFDPRRLEARDFAATIASAYGYSYVELTAPGRRPELVTLRARIARHLRQQQGLSLTTIGGVLCRTHSTVLNMLRMVEWRCGYCGHMVDTPMHELGCPVGREESAGPATVPEAPPARKGGINRDVPAGEGDG